MNTTSKLVDRIFINKKSGMEALVIGETANCIIAKHKGCASFMKSRQTFFQEFEPLIDGKGKCSFSGPPPL